MDNGTCSSDECQATASNINANVRTKVSSWVTNFVSEMRTKSPAVVQKWVDSIPNENNVSALPDTLTTTNITPLQKTTDEIFDESKTKELNSKSKQSNSEPKESEKKLNDLGEDLEYNTNESEEIVEQTEHRPHSTDSNQGRFWQQSPASILSAFRLRSSVEISSNEDISTPSQPQSECDEQSSCATPNSSSRTSMLSKSKLNDFYNKLSISKKRYSFIKERRMEAKKILSNAKSKFLQTTDPSADDMDEGGDDSRDINAISDKNTTRADIADAVRSTTEPIACDAVEMDISTDEFSRLSQSIDNLSVEDVNFIVSMPSINDGPSLSHLNVGRKVAIGDIGRSTSDNPRLRNKFHLGDIGRSFSEHQDDEAILIGERNISAPTSSIAIQNNNRSNGNHFERRAFSVSPTQRSLKRGILSRDHSLSDSPRHRHQLSKGNSFQSDSSHCSSVESLLDARKPDPEAILRHLGFGPVHQEDLLSRIPKRFLKPSQVPGIDTEAFLRQQQIASNLHEQSILGYRGLVGNPHGIPSMIVAKIMERFQLSDEKNYKLFHMLSDNRPSSAPPTPGINNDLFDIPDTEP